MGLFHHSFSLYKITHVCMCLHALRRVKGFPDPSLSQLFDIWGADVGLRLLQQQMETSGLCLGLVKACALLPVFILSCHLWL